MSSLLTFKDFNSLFNGDRKGYVRLHEGSPAEKGKLTDHILTYDEIVNTANNTPDMEIGWLIPKGYLVIDIDDRYMSDVVFKIIQDRKEKVMCVKTHRGMHIYCRSDYNNKTTNNIMACGVLADTIVHGNGASYICTPFKNPKVCTSVKLFDREVIYYNGIDTMPCWLTPVFDHSKKREDMIITYPLSEDRNESLNRHLWRLKTTKLNAEEREECIRIINQYVTVSPLPEKELVDTVLRKSNNEDNPVPSFFRDREFLHNVMGDYLIEKLHIKKNYSTHLLFYYNEDEGLYIQNDDYITGIMTKLCPSLKDFQRKEVLKYIDQSLELNLTKFNSDPYKVSFLNGRLNLYDLSFEPASPDHLETIHLNVNWNPEATGETADEFFATATCGDKLCEQLLYEAIGYSFIKSSGLQKAFLLYGGGRNGKTTFLNIVQEICGHENCTSVSFKDLGEKFRVAELYNKLVSICGDISSQPLKDSDLFKQVIGGDEITIEKKNKTPFTSTVFTTLFFSANKLPRTPDTTYGFYRKLVIIPFNANLSSVSLVEGNNFSDKLMKDKEYIAYKAALAIRNVLINTHTFAEPQSATDVMQQYKVENSSILSWIKYKDITKDHIKSMVVEELYPEYSVWCDLNGCKSVGSIRFQTEICEEMNMRISDNYYVDK